MEKNIFNGPAWDLSQEYASIESSEFQKDFTHVKNKIAEFKTYSQGITDLIKKYKLKTITDHEREDLCVQIQSQFIERHHTQIILYNLMTFVKCLASTSTRNTELQKWSSIITQLSNELSAAITYLDLFTSECEEEDFKKILSHPEMKQYTFILNHERKKRDLLLSESEEVLLSELRSSGFSSWTSLYKKIAGHLTVKTSAGLQSYSQAFANYFVNDEQVRKESWLAVQEAWKVHQDACAAILNSLAGWRLTLVQKRSHTRKIDFLSLPTHGNRIESKTLEAMMTAVWEERSVAQKAAKLMAKTIGKTQLDPWDCLAPYPTLQTNEKIPYQTAIAQIRNAFADMEPAMGDFIDIMDKNQWIDGRILADKAQGGYCTGFAKSRTPRVFVNFNGSFQDARVLAHELGHAYHNWVLRERPYMEGSYPMTLAETASIFAEYAWKDQVSREGTAEQKRTVLWGELVEAVSLLLNIPARFEFEKEFYQRRSEGELSAQELSHLTDQAWKKWFGDSLSQSETQYWQTKQHFSFDYANFYNFPYTFGGLFALGIYARRKEIGSAFSKTYKDILLDTGVMTAEDLVKKHLGEDISSPKFWKKSIQIMRTQVDAFELAQKLD